MAVVCLTIGFVLTEGLRWSESQHSVSPMARAREGGRDGMVAGASGSLPNPNTNLNPNPVWSRQRELLMHLLPWYTAAAAAAHAQPGNQPRYVLASAACIRTSTPPLSSWLACGHLATIDWWPSWKWMSCTKVFHLLFVRTKGMWPQNICRLIVLGLFGCLVNWYFFFYTLKWICFYLLTIGFNNFITLRNNTMLDKQATMLSSFIASVLYCPYQNRKR